ncbi:MAG: hypothetical protein LBS18_05870 [Clostridiales bacterium]|jgi:uncharacterized repeat protein (TIGR01451 family)|nr:hypothetical protein [Clostridiales bacterium]
MKKVISTICVFMFFILAASVAYAAEITITANPSTLSAPGYVNISFSVINDSGYTITDMKIRGYRVGDDDDSLAGQELPPAKALYFSVQNAQITQDMLGQPIVYTFYWTENGAQRSKETIVTVGLSADGVPPTPVANEMTGSRTASKLTGRDGEKITLTYTLKNPGTASMTNISVSDGIAGSTPIKSGITLEGGGSTAVTYEYTLGAQDATSEPVITYTVSGENKTLRLDKLTIAVVNVNISTTVSMADPTQEGVLFTITLTNSGNQTISDINVQDDLGTKVNTDNITLQAGQESVMSTTIKSDTLRNVSFTITGKDATGQPYEDKTQSYEVRPYVDPSNVSLQLYTTIVENLDENGNMKIRFTIKNDSQVEIVNATISEKLLGNVITTMPVLQPGETAQDVDLKIGEPRELEFMLLAYDPSGVERTYTSTITAAYTPTLTPAPISTGEPASAGGMSDTLVTVLIVLAVLMAVAGIALLALSLYERKRNAEMDALDADGYARAPRAQGGAVVERQADARVKSRKKHRRGATDDFEDIPPAQQNLDQHRYPPAGENMEYQNGARVVAAAGSVKSAPQQTPANAQQRPPAPYVASGEERAHRAENPQPRPQSRQPKTSDHQVRLQGAIHNPPSAALHGQHMDDRVHAPAQRPLPRPQSFHQAEEEMRRVTLTPQRTELPQERRFEPLAAEPPIAEPPVVKPPAFETHPAAQQQPQSGEQAMPVGRQQPAGVAVEQPPRFATEPMRYAAPSAYANTPQTDHVAAQHDGPTFAVEPFEAAPYEDGANGQPVPPEAGQTVKDEAARPAKTQAASGVRNRVHRVRPKEEGR